MVYFTAVNLRKLSSYVKEHLKYNSQCLAISLKDTFYEASDQLIGISKDVSLGSSRVLTLDLTIYDNDKKGDGKVKKRKRI
jgi:structural maintenance of chromosome 1